MSKRKTMMAGVLAVVMLCTCCLSSFANTDKTPAGENGQKYDYIDVFTVNLDINNNLAEAYANVVSYDGKKIEIIVELEYSTNNSNWIGLKSWSSTAPAPVHTEGGGYGVYKGYYYRAVYTTKIYNAYNREVDSDTQTLYYGYYN